MSVCVRPSLGVQDAQNRSWVTSALSQEPRLYRGEKQRGKEELREQGLALESCSMSTGLLSGTALTAAGFGKCPMNGEKEGMYMKFRVNE